jgi:eukaryotic-like serine/threonine-protein kinase
VDWTPPPVFDEYRLVRSIGHGAMGQVYLAHDHTLDREVAVKFLALPPSEAALGRFLVEARAAARLQHPNIVTVHRIGALDGRPFIVTEMLRGTPLDELPRPVPWRDVLAMGIDLASGLAAAHRAGILHRDLKPANAIRRDSGEVVLVDFGLAKLTGLDGASASGQAAPAFTVRNTAERLAVSASPVPRARGADPLAETATPVPDATQPLPEARAAGENDRERRSPSDSQIMGTPLYMAPEVLEGEPASACSDVYSLGVLLYELVAGNAPHRSQDFAELISKKLRDDVPPLAWAVPETDARLARIIDRCLARDPEQRYASADELRDALETLESARPAAPVEGNPYRGLLPFGPEHRGLFFGRTRDTRAVIDRLRGERFVLVVGESGVGKSSLCRASVAPAVEDGALDDGRTWTSAVVTPGSRPAVALAGALGVPVEELREHPAAAVRDLQRRLGAQRGLLVVLDQLEELVTLADSEEADLAGATITAIVQSAVSIRVLATARGDLIAKLAALPALGSVFGRALHALLPLDADGVRESVLGPARASGVRFADDAIVDDLVAAAGRSEAGLPLLQFALAELWERRDADGVITAEAVTQLGGVEGALARHADHVLAAMLPEERAAARRILVRLATTQRTRARRPVAELAGADPVARAAIDRLVESRLLVAREHDGEPTIEVAHEALFSGWPRLREWIDEEGGVARMRERIATAAQDWERDGRPSEALWGPRALLSAEAVPAPELDARSRQFLAASHRARRVRRIAAAAAVVAIAGAAVGVWAVTRWQSRKALTASVDERLRTAAGEVDEARRLRDQLAELRKQAYDAFDARRLPDGEARWAEALAMTPEVATAYGGASSSLEAALRLDPGRSDVRRFLLEVLYERAVLTDADRQTTVRDELLARIGVYDDDHAIRNRWDAPAQLHVRTDATTVLVDNAETTSSETLELSSGSHLLTFRGAGKAEVRLPVRLERGREMTIDVSLPAASSVPDGFVYVPPGEFRFGSSGDEGRRTFFGTAPEHVRTTGAFLIARHETTYADWIAFLDELSPEERERRRPKVGASGFRGLIELAPDGQRWALVFQPTPDYTYRFRAGETFDYVDRERNAHQDWMRFPVSGISWEDALAYVRWLRESGKVPGARMCGEDEWARAARGADGRMYPTGATLGEQDANIDATYGRRPRAYGPDEVGLHPESDSPFGLSDTAGNVFEMTASVLDGEGVARGGAYYFGLLTAAAPNRQVIEPTLRDPSMGLRVCADAGAATSAAQRKSVSE